MNFSQHSPDLQWRGKTLVTSQSMINYYSLLRRIFWLFFYFLFYPLDLLFYIPYPLIEDVLLLLVFKVVEDKFTNTHHCHKPIHKKFIESFYPFLDRQLIIERFIRVLGMDAEVFVLHPPLEPMMVVSEGDGLGSKEVVVSQRSISEMNSFSMSDNGSCGSFYQKWDKLVQYNRHRQ